MADLINRDELIYHIVNRRVTTPDFVGDGVAESWRNGYVTCQHNILDIIESAKPVALGTDHVVINWTPDLDKFARDVAFRGLNEFSFNGKSVREWVEIILEQMATKTQIEWVSVGDRLPDKYGPYLVILSGPQPSNLRMAVHYWTGNKDSNFWRGSEAGSRINGVTHWMELPKGPEEVEQNGQ